MGRILLGGDLLSSPEYLGPIRVIGKSVNLFLRIKMTLKDHNSLRVIFYARIHRSRSVPHPTSVTLNISTSSKTQVTSQDQVQHGPHHEGDICHGRRGRQCNRQLLPNG